MKYATNKEAKKAFNKIVIKYAKALKNLAKR